MITITVICKHSSERKAISALLSIQHDFKIVDWGKDGYDAMCLVEARKPNVLIMDLYLSDTDPADFAPVLKRKSPDTLLMILSNLNKNYQAGRILNAGIAAYLLKQEDMNKLAVCIRLVCSGGCYVSSSIMKQVFTSSLLLHCFPGQSKESPNKPSFSSSERRIIVLITQGLSDTEIANRLYLARGTVRNCLAIIKRKTGTKNRVQLAFYALSHGLVRFEQVNTFSTSVAAGPV